MTVAFVARDSGSSVARRRRERPLRLWMRHERMTVRMELTTALHQVQGPRRTTLHGARRRSTPGRKRCSSSCLTKTAGSRPGPVVDPRPQERVRQHTVRHLPLRADSRCSCVHFFRSLDTQLPVEQVIDVPKISEDIIQPRLVDRDLRFPQIVVRLVEVPTFLSYASLWQQTVENTVNIPVPRGRRRAQVVEVVEVFNDRIQQRLLSRALTFQFLVVPFHDLHPDPGSPTSSVASRD